MLEIRDLRKTYKTKEESVLALQGVDLTVNAGDFVVILGPSGCGKTTLLNIVAGIDSQDKGEIFFKGESLNQKSERERSLLRRHEISLIFQNFELIPVMNVYDNIALVQYSDKNAPNNRLERRQFIRKLAEELDLDNLLKRRPSKISGGQKQRVAILRGLVNHPSLVLGAEVTGNLDKSMSVKVYRLFQRMSSEEGLAFLTVTHDWNLLEFASRSYTLVNGKLKEGHV